MKRERWTSRSSFIMAAIGSAIGLGNIWRFPYVAYANGGSAFLIPYVLALITTGIPLVALEYYLGARYQLGPTEVFAKIKKKSNFIGWFAISIAAMITFYYTAIMGWSWNYLFHSLGINWAGNETGFFYDKVLGLTEGINEFGGFNLPVLIGTFLTWLAIFLIIFKGIKVVSKVVKWTVGLPWLLLGILIIRGFTLKGASLGLEYFLNPDFSKILDPKVWLAAYGQIFFSLSLGLGIMISYSSYLPRKTDINTNAWVVSFSNCATSFFAGFAVFSTLGYLATVTNQPIGDVAESGIGLAFIVFPTAIAKLPGGVIINSIFGIMFFLMLLTLGIDSAFSLVEAAVTSLRDSFKFKREKVTLVVCIIGFVVSLIYTTRCGLYWLDIVDRWMNWGLVIVGFMEAVLIGYFFDVNKVSRDIDSTSNIKFGNFWKFSIKFLTPLVLLITIVTNIVQELKVPYGGYPMWALLIGGWLPLIYLFIMSFIIQDISRRKKRLKSLFILNIALVIVILLELAIYFFSPALVMGVFGVILFFGGAIYGVTRLPKDKLQD